jgi:hypothetical protein
MRRLRQARRWTVLELVGSIALVLIGTRSADAGEAPKEAGKGATPTAAATSFYRAVLELHVLGVPDEANRRKLAPRLSPGLTDLFAKADAAEAAYREATRNEVPPIVQGDLFSSLFEGANHLDGVSCDDGKDRAVCTVELRYEMPREGEAEPQVSRWKDRVTMVPGAPGGAPAWVVDDIEYGGDWQFMHKGTLRRLLENVIQSGNEEAARAKEEGRLLGGWVHVGGETEFEQISFDVEDGRQVFRSWLHERPELVGQWTREGDAVTIHGSDGTKTELGILSVSESTLEVRFAGAKEKSVFRRPKAAAP